MNNKDVARKIRDIKVQIRKNKHRAAELDMDDAIMLAAKAGVLSVPVNFHWLDLEVQ